MKIQSIFLLCVSGILLNGFPSGVAAEIELQSGKVLEAEILGSSEKMIKVNYQDRILYYKWYLIKNIDGMPPFTAVTTQKTSPVTAEAESPPQSQPISALAIRGKTPWIQKKDRQESNPPLTSGSSPKNDFDQGMIHAARGEFSQAEKFFLKARNTEQTARNAEEALHILADFYRGDIGTMHAINLFKGAHLLIKKEYRQAIAVYEDILARNPQAIEVYYNIGDAYTTLEEYEQAIPYFEKIIETNPDDTDVWFHLAFAYYSTDQYKKAIPYFEKITEIYPDNAEAFTLLGVSYQASGQYARAKKKLTQAHRLFSRRNDSEKARELKTLLDQYRLYEIKETIEDVLKEKPSS